MHVYLNGSPVFIRVGRRGRDRMVVGFTTTCAISVFHHKCCEFEPRGGNRSIGRKPHDVVSSTPRHERGPNSQLQ